MEITKTLQREELAEIESKLCNARCDLEELAEMLRYEEMEIADMTGDDVQDLADAIAEMENHIFEFLENEK